VTNQSPTLPDISDDFMRQMLPTTRTYTVVILHGPNREVPDADTIIWEHGRRNFALRQAGLLSVVCPIGDGTGIAGVGVFNAPIEQVDELCKSDPAVRAGVLTYEVHQARGFPGDSLP